ncbi:MAG: Flp pilus assembly protein CpaB [Bacillota bacterium]
MLKNKFVVGILCIIVGLLIGFVAMPELQNGQGGQITVVRMKKPVSAGERITAEMVEAVSIPKSVLPNGIDNTAAAIGKYANTELYTGDFLTNEKLSVVQEEQNALAAGTKKGKTVVSVTLPSLASGVSGRLHPGDVVTVMALPKTGDINKTLGVEPAGKISLANAPAVIYPELQYLEVCMVTTKEGANADMNANPGKDKANSLPVTVSFYATQDQALLLGELEQQGIIHLAFVARGNDAAKYIPDDKRIMNVNQEVK